MPLLENSDLRRILSRLTVGMLSYIESGVTGYGEGHVDECREILVSHAAALELAKDRDASLELVKSTIMRLNRLNSNTGGNLIETDQREEICAFIIKAGAAIGHNTESEDVTEGLRELTFFRVSFQELSGHKFWELSAHSTERNFRILAGRPLWGRLTS